MLGRSSGNHDWLLVNASACVSCGFRLRNARNASDCVLMKTGLTHAGTDFSVFRPAWATRFTDQGEIGSDERRIVG